MYVFKEHQSAWVDVHHCCWEPDAMYKEDITSRSQYSTIHAGLFHAGHLCSWRLQWVWSIWGGHWYQIDISDRQRWPVSCSILTRKGLCNRKSTKQSRQPAFRLSCHIHSSAVALTTIINLQYTQQLHFLSYNVVSWLASLLPQSWKAAHSPFERMPQVGDIIMPPAAVA